jgi:anti-sigma regulatory factor (Ser/Thr protein kinase)
MRAEPALRHHAFVYASDEEYVERSAAFLREGLAAGEGCIVAHSRDGIALMRDALGPDAAQVSFVDVSCTYTRPAHALAAYYGTLLEHLKRAPSVRAVAEMQLGPTLQDWEEWVGYEALCNLAYAHLPAWVVCTYGADRVPEAILEDVWRTHPDVLSDDWHASDCYEEPRTTLRAVTPAPEELPELRSFRAGADLEAFRERLARELVAQRVPEARALDLLVAGSEIADNAVRYGGGIEEVRVGSAHGRFVCEVIDRGSGFDDPAAGYVAPYNGNGAGLWVARQLAWNVETFRSPRGFTVRLWL